MKALKVYRNAIVKVEEVEEPIVGNNEVKIQVSACGICGSDIPRVWENKAHFYPIILGHEFSGIVTEVGDHVKNIMIGDHVVGVPLIPCNNCPDCDNGNYSLCKNYSFIGSRRNGAMAEYLVLPENNVLKLPHNINLFDAALIEPLSVVLHALQQNKHQVGKSVAVLGMGTIGALIVQAIKYYGVKNITVFIRNDKYTSLIKKIGVNNIVNTSKEDWQKQVEDITDKRGFDMVYETAGSDQTILQSFIIAGNKAHVCFVGTPKREVAFSTSLWEMINRKEMYLTGSWMSYSKEFPGSEWNEAINLLDHGNVKIYPEMINEEISLNSAANIFDDYKDGRTITGRKLIVMR